MRWIIRLGELTEDWTYLLERDGWKSGLWSIKQELGNLPYRRLEFKIIVRSLLEPIPTIKPKIDLEIRPFNLSDIELVRQIDRPSEAKLCAARLTYGYKGLLALHQGQTVGHAWACGKINPVIERIRPKLELGDMLCVDAYTTPAFRGQGVQTALTLARFQLFHELGYRRAVTYIGVHNLPSLMVWQKKLGGQTQGKAIFIRIGPWRWVRFS